jgi:hypothetical protein
MELEICKLDDLHCRPAMLIKKNFDVEGKGRDTQHVLLFGTWKGIRAFG